MSARTLQQRWREGERTFGFWCCLAGQFAPEVAAARGAAYVCIDRQHGAIGSSALTPMFQAVEAGGAAPLCRVASNDAHPITQALDAGAVGVIVPMVESAEDARRFVDLSTYPPRGRRSFAGMRATVSRGTTDPATLDDVARIAMIETRAGLDRVAEIAAVDGIDAIYIGPSDLALALGLPLGAQRDDPRFVEAVATIVAACRANGLAAGMHCESGEVAARYAAEGFDMLTVGSDVGLLGQGVSSAFAAAHG
jgi:4-hydroxy-2-oxoheptanedioate aldolase